MSRVSDVLRTNRVTGGSLIGYFPIGYPNLSESIEAAVAMCESGVDVLELGVPYSDPVMDGLVIQQATEVSLANGFKLEDVFEAIKRISDRVETPLLVMSYWNPIMQYGTERFASRLAEAGAAGAITPDLIPDEAQDWIRQTDASNLDRVFLATPSSSDERIANTALYSRGFVYAVSTMGITGERTDLDAQARSVVSKIRKQSPQSFSAVGIGISTADQVKQVNSYADGAIVGSAFVRAYQDFGISGLISKVKELATGKK
jgi:tryptophan synthase alpha chain